MAFSKGTKPVTTPAAGPVAVAETIDIPLPTPPASTSTSSSSYGTPVDMSKEDPFASDTGPAPMDDAAVAAANIASKAQANAEKGIEEARPASFYRDKVTTRVLDEAQQAMQNNPWARFPIIEIRRGLTHYPFSFYGLPDMPDVLYVRGNPALLNIKNVAIIGTREPTEYAKKKARYIAKVLAEQGYGVNNGGARGIDTEALIAALEAGGPIIVFLVQVDKFYPPENQDLFLRILEAGGLLVSEHAPGTDMNKTFKRALFRRDRLQAALADAVVPIQTAHFKVEKGVVTPYVHGTMHTCEFAERYKRPIYLPELHRSERDDREKYTGIIHLMKKGYPTFAPTKTLEVLGPLLRTDGREISDEEAEAEKAKATAAPAPAPAPESKSDLYASSLELSPAESAPAAPEPAPAEAKKEEEEEEEPVLSEEEQSLLAHALTEEYQKYLDLLKLAEQNAQDGDPDGIQSCEYEMQLIREEIAARVKKEQEERSVYFSSSSPSSPEEPLVGPVQAEQGERTTQEEKIIREMAGDLLFSHFTKEEYAQYDQLCILRHNAAVDGDKQMMLAYMKQINELINSVELHAMAMAMNTHMPKEKRQFFLGSWTNAEMAKNDLDHEVSITITMTPNNPLYPEFLQFLRDKLDRQVIAAREAQAEEIRRKLRTKEEVSEDVKHEMARLGTPEQYAAFDQTIRDMANRNKK